MSEPEERDKELYAAIDAEAGDVDEQNDSKVIYQTLKGSRQQLSGSSDLPAEDEHLSEQIMAAATQRSHEVSAATGHVASSRLDAEGRPIPAWMWVLWVVVLIAAALAFTMID